MPFSTPLLTKGAVFLSRTGIIAEFNPFHNGHAHIINEIKQTGDHIVCALGGNFVQRGDLAVFSKYDRTKAALKAGADLVCEIPSAYTMTTAQGFAMAGVWQLYNLGCDRIVFGSESGDIELLSKTADILLSDKYSLEAAKLLKSGETFAKIRESAAKSCGADISALRSPNDNLGTEYILAAKRMRLNIAFDTVKRAGTLHDADSAEKGFASGSYIRDLIKKGDFEAAKAVTPDFVHPLLCREKAADISLIERMILGILRTKSKDELALLPDVSEGIENRLYEAIKTATTLDGLYEAVKTKRYTLSRVRRLVLSAALGLDASFFLTVPPYTRILGANSAGLSLLKNTLSLSPVISRGSDAEKLDERSKKLFLTECRAADLYALAFDTPLPCGSEYTAKFIKAE